MILGLILLSAFLSHAKPYVSRPDIDNSFELQILQQPRNSSDLTPGYFFIAPLIVGRGIHSYGPHIFDINGHAIWYGGATVRESAQNFHVCNLRDGRLCYTDCAFASHCQGGNRFLDSSFGLIETDSTSDADYHELNALAAERHNALFSSFLRSKYVVRGGVDLSRYSASANGSIWDSCFEEVDYPTMNVVFSWCSADFIPLSESYTSPNDANGGYVTRMGGDGTEKDPWDYFHINSVDKVEDTYLVSGRHTSTIYRIAGPGFITRQVGEVIHRLGGKNSDVFLTPDLDFSWQHDVRYLETRSGKYVLSFMDNASDGGSMRSSSRSAGKVIEVNWNAKLANLTVALPQPGGLLATSQGNVQTLLGGSGNRVVGWGNLPYVSEFSPDGSLLWHAHLGAVGSNSTFTYRAYKAKFTGSPAESQLAAAVDRYSDEHTVCGSWNGATEIASWQARGYDNDILNSSVRTGFETCIQVPSSAVSIRLEALDGGGRVLGRSQLLTRR